MSFLQRVDKEGRTPLILACTRGELLGVAECLIELGANLNAYRPGIYCFSLLLPEANYCNFKLLGVQASQLGPV